jgi:hypothetical protein
MKKTKTLKKNKSAQTLGKLGAAARNKKLTTEERSESSRHAVTARWERVKAAEKESRK